MDEHALHRLIEECAEVQKAACKMLRFGAGFINPKTGIANAHELRQECADLSVVIEQAVNCSGVDWEKMRADKAEKIEKWKFRERKNDR